MSRFDPYKNFKFRVKWEGRTVAGVSHVSPLKRTTEVVKGREGRVASQPRSEFEAITLERGVTHDPEFEAWANRVHSGLRRPDALREARRDLQIEVYNEAGQLEVAYIVYGCWVSEFQALPELDANANAVAIQHLRLENEGWSRDEDSPEPTEPPL